MKKSLVALAVLGAVAGTASAQSSVTIYGLINLGVTKDSCATNCATNPAAPAGKAYMLQSFATSRLGFRGTEDLGGGLSAQFQLEHRFAPDTGAVANANAFWQGRSFVQLTSAAIGSVYMGRDYTPIFWVQLKSDPFGNDGIAQANVANTYANYATPDPATPAGPSARASNSIGFKSVSFGGLTAQAAVSLSEASQQGRGMGANVEYAAGPIYAALGYETNRKGTNDGTGVVNGAFHYDFGFVKAILYAAQSRTRTAGTTNQENKNNMWMLAATAPLGGGLLKAQFSHVDPRFANNTRTKLGLGYDYFLSKRTNLWAEAALAREDSRTNNNAFGFGIKHAF